MDSSDNFNDPQPGTSSKAQVRWNSVSIIHNRNSLLSNQYHENKLKFFSNSMLPPCQSEYDSVSRK